MDATSIFASINWEQVTAALIVGAGTAYTYAKRVTMTEFEGWVDEFNASAEDNVFEMREVTSLFARLIKMFKK